MSDGDDTTPIRLVSAEGTILTVDRRVACASPLIRTMLASNMIESRGEIRFPEMSAAVLELVISYLQYKVCAAYLCKLPPCTR